ncbi:MAG: hypothetical protein HUJ56_13140 [Erysipelotrichaceae bacterium]|nr:hypothetical protein [Erysipelotrichaceae bacterium]
MDKIWYYRNGESTAGPLTERMFVNLIRQGLILPEHEIYMGAMEHWMKLSDTVYMFYAPKQEDEQAD